MSVLKFNHKAGTLIYVGEEAGIPALLKFGTLAVEIAFPIFYPPFFDPRTVEAYELDQRTSGVIVDRCDIRSDVLIRATPTLSGDWYIFAYGLRPISIEISGLAFIRVCDQEKGRTADDVHPIPSLLLLANETAAPVLNNLLYLKLGDLYLYGPLFSFRFYLENPMHSCYRFNLQFVAKPFFAE